MIVAIKYATQDNYRALIATDNYIEKYQPFFMQHLISDSLQTIFNRHSESGLHKISRFREYEHNKYREWHKLILNDNGLPSL